MAVEDPGEFTVTCDICGATIQADSTAYCGSPASYGVEETTLEDLDWSCVDGETFCPKCKDKDTEEDE